MALIGIRNLIKSYQPLSESLIFNTRSIAISNLRRNTTAEEINQEQSPNVSEKNPELQKLNEQISKLTAENSDLLDKYKRTLADRENLRDRLTKQIAEAKIYSIQGFCKDLLDVADVLSKATETVPKEEITDKNPHLKSLYEGLIMTESQLKSVFRRHGLEPVNPINEKFDPNFHEALFQMDAPNKDSGIVVVVSKAGYKLKDRVLRPALVGVSK